MREINKDWVKGYTIGKKIDGSQYPVVVDDFNDNRDAFLRGMAFAGFRGEVQFSE